MNKRNAYLAASLATVVAGAAALGGVAGRVHAQPAQEAVQPSAQVVLAPVQMKQMHATLAAYGDVLPGSLQSVSSPSSARIARLNVMQGQSVKRGEVLAMLEGDPAVQLAYAQAGTALRQANADMERIIAMQKLQLATQSQVDAAAKAKADAESGMAAQRELGGAKGGLVIRAADDGVVMALTAFQGDRVQPGTPFMQIGSTGNLKVVLGIDPADLPKVRKGMAVGLATLAAPDRSVAGKVAEVQNIVDPKTQLANVLVRVPAAGQLVPGTRVRAEIELDGKNAFEVPRQAVLTDANGSYVFQVGGHAAHRIAVRPVVDNGRTLGVSGSIDPALPVVVQGNYELAEGMHVREAR